MQCKAWFKVLSVLVSRAARASVDHRHMCVGLPQDAAPEIEKVMPPDDIEVRALLPGGQVKAFSAQSVGSDIVRRDHQNGAVGLVCQHICIAAEEGAGFQTVFIRDCKHVQMPARQLCAQTAVHAGREEQAGKRGQPGQRQHDRQNDHVHGQQQDGGGYRSGNGHNQPHQPHPAEEQRDLFDQPHRRGGVDNVEQVTRVTPP